MSTALARRGNVGRTVGYAAAILGVGAAGGAAVGAVNATPCPSPPAGLCGPTGGAVRGAMYGLMAAGGFGLLLTASRDWRAVGITTAGIGFAAFVATGMVGAAIANSKAAA